MPAVLFKSKEELKGFVLDVIEISPLSGRVDGLTGRVDVLTERVDVLTGRADVLTGRVDVLTGRVDVLTGRVDVLTERVDVLTERVDVLTERVDVLTERVDVLTERVDVLTERVDVLTERVDGLCVRMERVETILLAERARNEERDIKINAIYDVVIAIRDDAVERNREFNALAQREGATRAKLTNHVENRKIHVSTKRGRPRKKSSQDELG